MWLFKIDKITEAFGMINGSVQATKLGYQSSEETVERVAEVLEWIYHELGWRPPSESITQERQ